MVEFWNDLAEKVRTIGLVGALLTLQYRLPITLAPHG